ncbi:MAG TPA: hypothetical protein VF831_00315, partial [Anaerolineales bacterium]
RVGVDRIFTTVAVGGGRVAVTVGAMLAGGVAVAFGVNVGLDVVTTGWQAAMRRANKIKIKKLYFIICGPSLTNRDDFLILYIDKTQL